MITLQSVFVGFLSSLFVYLTYRTGKYFRLSDKLPVSVVALLSLGTIAGVGYSYVYEVIRLDAYLVGILYSVSLWFLIMVIAMPIRGYGIFGLKEDKQIIFSSLALATMYGFLLGLLISL